MLSHINQDNQPEMVDVSKKKVTCRTAHAQAFVDLPENIISLLQGGEIHLKKGPVFQTAIIAGVMAAKKTSELIPLCHPIGLEDCKLDIQVVEKNRVEINCYTTVEHKTGVEMEALTGASVAALTIYDMCKAMSHDISISQIHLKKKTGGKSDYIKN